MYRLTPALFLLCSTAGLTATVYKSVDENGVVNFSDTPPSNGLHAEVLQVTASTPQPPEAHLERLAAMREATDRMAADRRERERHRAELREIKAKTASYRPPAQPRNTEYAGYYPVYSRYYPRSNYPPLRPGYRPKPVHPIVHPPMRPGHGNFGSSNAQLMRPLVSTRR